MTQEERSARDYFILALKGFAMGAANVIPGVSGGTIALIAGIYEEFIYSLKSFDGKALKLLLKFRIKELLRHIHFGFLAAVFGGSLVSIFTIAKLFKYLFAEHPILIWAFFFGLILASVYYIGKTVHKWNTLSVVMLLIGVVIAVGISMLNPATENENLFYVFICGIIGISGMMLPGLSGSFILILMGNYQLLMVKAIAEFRLVLLTVFAAGSVFGLVSFAQVLAWIFKRYRDATIALLTGFVLGSLNIIWPWKKEIFLMENGVKKLDRHGEAIVVDYEKVLPESPDAYTWGAIGLILAGIIVLWAIERTGQQQKEA